MKGALAVSNVPTAKQLLEGLITNGILHSQYEAYTNSRIRNGETWYTSTKSKLGADVAEARLAVWNRRARMSDFAAGIELVARGMLAQAEGDFDAKYTRVIEVTAQTNFPRCYDIDGPSHMVVVLNRNTSACCGNQTAGKEDWAPSGRLGLIAVTLQAGYDHSSVATAKLGLVLARRAFHGEPSNEDGYTVATIDLSGFTSAHTYRPKFHMNGYLLSLLGLIPPHEAIRALYSGGGNFEDAFGFPGATDYVANRLPSLAEYLTSLAGPRTTLDLISDRTQGGSSTTFGASGKGVENARSFLS